MLWALGFGDMLLLIDIRIPPKELVIESSLGDSFGAGINTAGASFTTQLATTLLNFYREVVFSGSSAGKLEIISSSCWCISQVCSDFCCYLIIDKILRLSAVISLSQKIQTQSPLVLPSTARQISPSAWPSVDLANTFLFVITNISLSVNLSLMFNYLSPRMAALDPLLNMPSLQVFPLAKLYMTTQFSQWMSSCGPSFFVLAETAPTRMFEYLVLMFRWQVTWGIRGYFEYRGLKLGLLSTILALLQLITKQLSLALVSNSTYFIFSSMSFLSGSTFFNIQPSLNTPSSWLSFSASTCADLALRLSQVSTLWMPWQQLTSLIYLLQSYSLWMILKQMECTSLHEIPVKSLRQTCFMSSYYSQFLARSRTHNIDSSRLFLSLISRSYSISLSIKLLKLSTRWATLPCISYFLVSILRRNQRSGIIWCISPSLLQWHPWLMQKTAPRSQLQSTPMYGSMLLGRQHYSRQGSGLAG